MSTLTELLADPMAGQTLHLATAALPTQVHSDLIDWGQGKIDALSVLWKSAVGLAVAIFGFILMASSGFKIGRVLAITASAALIIWLVCFDGIAVVGQALQQETQGIASGTTISIIEDQDA